MAAESTMSHGWKTALLVVLVAGIVIAVVGTVVAPLSYYTDAARDQTPVDTFHLVAGWIAGIAGALAAGAVIYAFVWVIRHMKGRARTLWAVGLVFFGPVAALAWWWRVVRPLPDSD